MRSRQLHIICSRQIRFYVKEVSWCRRDGSRLPQEIKAAQDGVKTLKSPKRIGVIAAVSQNHVIGRNGKLPWDIPEDIRYFREVTKDKVVVTGRVSFEDTDDQSHLSQTRWNILISNSVNPDSKKLLGNKTKVARSFDEAMDIARHLASLDSRDDTNNIDCWVVGGERIFEEALRHPAIHELRLTRADIHVDERHETIAKFPAKYRWDYRFKEIRQWEGEESGSDNSGRLRYLFHIYQCFRQR